MKKLLLTTIAFFSAILSPTITEAQTVDYCVNNAFGNPITGNCSEHYKGVTYIAYQGTMEDPYVVAYDHNNSKWIGPYKVGTSLLGKDPNKKIDNHGKPTLVIDSKGYIHVVFGGHGGTPNLGENKLGNYNGGKQIHVKSTKPMDITEWEEVDNITPFGTYSQFIKMDNGDIYLFYRHGAHRSNWIYQVSKDDCKTFTQKKSFLAAKPCAEDGERLNIWDSWYTALEKGNNDNIIVLYSYHKCHTINGQHVGERFNGYYMELDTKSDTWRNKKGDILKLPLTKEDSDAQTLAVATPGKWTHLGDIGLDETGNPRMYWYEGEDNGTQYGGRKRLVNYCWDGSTWTGGNTNLPIEARGEMVAESTKSLQYLLTSTTGSSSEIAWWSSSDGGKEFSKGDVVISDDGKGYTISHFVLNGRKDAYIVATQKIDGTDYSKLYLIGDDGVIQRKKADADIVDLSFETLNNTKEWRVALNDNCTDDWQKSWFLDGKKATIKNSDKGMSFAAGPEADNHTHHAVLWTKESFKGDIKIEYDYTRTDEVIKFVTLLYIQATGDEEGKFSKDITEWNKFREEPYMKYYFENMNLLHISYAAFGNDGDGLYYIRARRYPKPNNKGFNTIELDPSYDYQGYVKSNQRYHITAIKSGNMLYFKMASKDGEELFSWDLSGIEPITEGRVGLRHMFTRSAIYKNLKIYTK